MSRPLVWNGTTWKDPSFHIGGGAYRTYIPPAYDQVFCNAQFTSGPEGFEWSPDGPSQGWSANEGGYIYTTNPDGFMTAMHLLVDSTANPLYVPTDLTPAIGHLLRMRRLVRYRTLVGGPFDGEITQDIWSLSGARWQQPSTPDRYMSFGAAGWDSGWYWEQIDTTTPVEKPTYGGWGSTSLYIEQNIYTGPMGGGFTGWMGWAAVEIYDVTTGQLLMDLGDPGWEPKVRRLDGTWK